MRSPVIYSSRIHRRRLGRTTGPRFLLWIASARPFSIPDNRRGDSTRLAHARVGWTSKEYPGACTKRLLLAESALAGQHESHAGYSQHLGPRRGRWAARPLL